MLSIFITIIISIAIICVLHTGFNHFKNKITTEKTANIGVYQSKKYDDLISELKDIKETHIENSLHFDKNPDMESELTEFMNEIT
jgi:hypothetical protein